MKKPFFIFYLLIQIIIASCYAQAQEIKMADSVRGARYCEILLVNGKGSNMVATVYNTLSCNYCPQKLWRQQEANKLKKEFKAKAVILNGPRYFLMDKIGQSNAAPPVVNFDGLEMKERAKVKIPAITILKGKSKPYAENVIHRSTEYVFKKGSRVYEIISPAYTYIMQSYAQIIDSTLTEKDLPGLASRLKLPKGWQFITKVLDEDLVLKTFEASEAFVIQDELNNTYQRIK